MSFRNIRQKQAYRVLRTRSPIPSDEQEWHESFKAYLFNLKQNALKFTVENWVVITSVLVSGITSGIIGFFLGKKYGDVAVLKDIAGEITRYLPAEVRRKLPTKATIPPPIVVTASNIESTNSVFFFGFA